MVNNRSVPANIMLAHLVYSDIVKAGDWLARVFGFKERFKYGSPDGIQMCLGEACIMLQPPRSRLTPAELGYGTQSLTIFVEHLDAHYVRAQAGGAEIWEPLHETEYGERQYGASDLDGHKWLFAKHVRDVAPEEWGGQPAATSK